MATQNENSQLSFNEIKALIDHAQTRKVAVFEYAGLRFQFHPEAFNDDHRKPAPKVDTNPNGHFIPE